MLYANSSDSIIIRRKDWELDISLRQKIDIGAKSTSGGHAIDFAAKAGLKFGYVAVKIFDGNALTPHTEDFSMFSFPIAPRRRLKIGNMPSVKEFFRWARRFGAEILCVFQGKATRLGGKKARRLGVLTIFKQALTLWSVG